MPRYRSHIKGALDFSVCFFGLIAFSWLFLGILFFYWITNNTPIFFQQERIGLNNKVFTILKFRTLSLKEHLPLIERTFALGQFLRRTSLDELPQLWNVLKGDMSLVGPRPLPAYYLTRFSDQQLIRHTVKPGITGLAQVMGRHRLTWSQKFKFDLFYVSKTTFSLDALIVWKTAQLIFSWQKDRSLEEIEFTGL
jgi:undecaprenyl phosphate N,N'-diacetylbacillosamine 1-phosphate transferase